ncbi:hypothetical protein LSH36_1150g00017 [Paralvinella palmiformis]|uniref:Transposase Helix-turn-helix domain-containing protein n=1 Tax=Paralvinella palmiformis TaxID=53620 RepID=A0AAD9IUD5_9ANNE|nr:hypothetical protein LSH36_1150g00017 [Paralvinella palmiformis]
MQKRLKPTAVPYIFKWSDLPSPASAERIRRGLKKEDICIVDGSTQTVAIKTREEVIQCEMDSLSFSIFHFRNDCDGIHFYSESFECCMFIFATLSPASNQLSYVHNEMLNIVIDDQFFLTMIKLWQHKTSFELSRMFKVSQCMAMNIFLTWINLM